MPKIPKLGKKVKQAASAGRDVAKRAISRQADKARKRLRRAKDRYEQMVQQATGLERQRYRALVEDLNEQIDKSYAIRSGKDKGKYIIDVDTLEKRSEDYLSVNIEKNIGSKLLKGALGRRVYAMTVGIWRDRADGQTIDESITEAFGVGSMDEVIDRLYEELGASLYDDLDSGEYFSSDSAIVLAGQQYVSRIVNANA